MSDLNSMDRENKKKQLRNRVISNNQRPRLTGEEEDAVRKAHRKVLRRRWIVAIVLLILLTAGGAGVYHYLRFYQYTSYTVSWEQQLNEGSLVGYEYFGTNVLKYTKDGASYTDLQGKMIWSQSYEMKSPAVSINGDFAAIADIQGNNVYICNKDGLQGVATTVLPISRVAVAGNGVVAVILEDSGASYITFFKRDGSTLDITIKTKMSGDGHPLDIALSADGTQLMCSFAYIQGGEMKNRVVFYDFSEIGKNVPNRLVGGFDEPFQSSLVARVHYLGAPYSCAFAGDGVTFFSSRNLASPELLEKKEVKEEIRSIFYNEEYVGIVVDQASGENPFRMEVYKKNGSRVLSREFSYEYANINIDGDLVLLYNENSCEIYHLSGVQKFASELDFPVSVIRKGRFPNTIVVTGPQDMKELQLH